MSSHPFRVMWNFSALTGSYSGLIARSTKDQMGRLGSHNWASTTSWNSFLRVLPQLPDQHNECHSSQASDLHWNNYDSETWSAAWSVSLTLKMDFRGVTCCHPHYHPLLHYKDKFSFCGPSCHVFVVTSDSVFLSSLPGAVLIKSLTSKSPHYLGGGIDLVCGMGGRYVIFSREGTHTQSNSVT